MIDKITLIISSFFTYILFVLIGFVILIYQQNQLTVIIITIVVTAIYYLKQCFQWCLNCKNPCIQLITGELLHHILQITWLIFFPKNEYMYYVPLILNTSGKLFLIVNKKSENSSLITQQLILFQIKTEAFILFCLLIILIIPSYEKLIQFISFAIFCKLKHAFYYPAQKSYIELHFSLDRFTRRLGNRSMYHTIQAIISIFGGVFAQSKEISY